MAKTNCIGSAFYENLEFCNGKTVLPGIRQRVFFIPKRDIVKWPKLAETTTADMAELATYKGDFTLASDKKWLCLDLVMNKGAITSETQGENPSRTVVNKCTLTHPSNSADAAGFCRQAMADDIIYLVQQRDGKWRVLGNEMFPCDSKPGFNTGEGVTGESGTTIEVEVTDVCPAPFYTGKIETADGDANASDVVSPDH